MWGTCPIHGPWNADISQCPACYEEILEDLIDRPKSEGTAPPASAQGPIHRCPKHHKDFIGALCPDCADELDAKIDAIKQKEFSECSHKHIRSVSEPDGTLFRCNDCGAGAKGYLKSDQWTAGEKEFGGGHHCPKHHRNYMSSPICPDCVLNLPDLDSVIHIAGESGNKTLEEVAREFKIIETDKTGAPKLLQNEWYCKQHGKYVPSGQVPAPSFGGHGYHRVTCPSCAAAGIRVQIDIVKRTCEPLRVSAPEDGSIKGDLEVRCKSSLEFDPNGKAPSQLGDCLDEAKKTICGERQDVYGSPENSFAIIADYWNVYLDTIAYMEPRLTAKDVAHMMVLFKMARVQGQRPSRDNYVDLCGYAAIAADRLSSCEEDTKRLKEVHNTRFGEWGTDEGTWKDGAPGCPHTRTKFVKSPSGEYQQCLGCRAILQTKTPLQSAAPPTEEG